MMMKSLTRVFAAFLLAITIAFGGFSGNAHAQSTSAVPSIGIDANQTLEQILKLITSTQNFQLVIANATDYPLTRVGTYNDYGNWVSGDVLPNTVDVKDWTESGLGYFSFASNYAVGNTGKYFQFAASWPRIGSRKINLCNQNANTVDKNGTSIQAKACWDAMSNSDDKNLANSPFTGRAIMGNQNGRVQWAYQIKNS
jgi:hypothetical protein